MSLIEITLIAVSLAMDACAVSLCKGMSMKKLNVKGAFLIALCFGLFQAIMPLIGWFVGTKFETYISAVDHWVVFALLGIIGGKMLFEAFECKEDEDLSDFKIDFKEIIMLGIATSIDALAVGVSFAILDGVNIGISATIIGVSALLLSFAGVFIGHKFGAKFGKTAEILGGLALIGIGTKILIEHLFFS